MSWSVAAGLAGLLLAAGLPSLTLAQALAPNLRPGQWDMAMDMGGMAMTMKMCMDQSMQSRAAVFRPPAAGAAAAARSCSKQDVRPIPGGFASDSVCTVNGKTTRTSVTIIGDFQTHYTMNMDMRPDNGPERKIKTESRWMGPCPAGMKPGQVVMGDMSGMAAGMAAARRGRAGGE